MRSRETRICVFRDRRELEREKRERKKVGDAFQLVSFDSAWFFRGINNNIFNFKNFITLLYSIF